ncbi:MAG: GNAT family N-acetyltransferase [Bacteroidetes bacterium]|nr:GNAT family N-acetyltransferase [Bacteroidota bacterium]
MGDIQIRKVQSDRELDAIFGIRHEVFVVEQNVDPTLEYDEFEETSHHFIALRDELPVGTARWRRTPNGIKLERFAVLSDHRNQGVAAGLIRTILDDLPNQSNVYLHAQVQVCALYRKFGFVEEGDEFIEADIRHYKMSYRPV